MIHKPVFGQHPNGINAINVVRDCLQQAKIRHLRAGEKRIEGDYFIPEPWQMRGYILSPNITNQGLLFRGQPVDLDEEGNIPPTYSKLGAMDDDGIARWYWRLRRFDLNNMLRTNPLYRMLTWGVEIPQKKQRYFRISSSTILQSYGIPSIHVSLTSDMKIALFYAVTDYDEKNGCFVPTKKKFGILSFYEMAWQFSPTSKVMPVGLQVFQRPGLNKEFVCRLGRDEDYNNLMDVTGFLFEQNENISREVMDMFDGGKKLFPKEDVLLNQIKKSEGKLSSTALKWHQRLDYKANVDLGALKEKCEITDDVRDLLHFDLNELADYYGDIDEWWKKFCDKIYFEADPNLDRAFFERLPQDNYYGRFFERLRR